MNPEIIKELIKYKPKTKNDIETFKHKLCKQYNLNTIYNSELLSFYQILVKNQTIKPNPQLEKLLIGKNICSLSGVSIITISSKPYPCPGNCLYCPTQKSVPKSYLDNEPAILRAIRHNYDPITQVKERLEVLTLNGHPTDKLEIIVIGGTFSFFNKNYQANFIKKIFDACNNKKSKNLEQAQKLNEKSKNRIVGLTIETRPDFITNKEIKHLRKLGVTRVELGVQSIYDDILKLNNRGHLIKTTIEATKLLKDSGFKICYHIMPNLYGSNPKKDLQMFKELFTNQDFQPDMLKIYPCMVMKEAELYKIYKQKLYKPYDCKILTKLLKQILLILPAYVRVQRLVRDIPSQSIVDGVKISNLREIIEQELKQENKKIWEIRSREIKDEWNQKTKLKIFRTDYNASDGKEIFLSFEDINRNKLYSILRLRIPSKTKPIINTLKDSAIIREVHTYGKQIKISKKDVSAQHQGLGKQLINQAEQIAKKEFNLNKISVISGIGVREYYKKLGYKLKDTYMIKNIK